MTIKKPKIVMVDTGKIRPNEWNPNVMPPQAFNDLVDNIEELECCVQPVVVAPLEKKEGKFEYVVVDGEHRFEGLRLNEEKKIPCIVVDKMKGDGYAQRKQTVRLNKIKGSMDKRKLADLVTDMMEEEPFDVVAEDLLFHDPTELEELLRAARESLPTEEMREAFDRAKEDIRSVDDLSLVLNRLFTSFGDTLPANFMILDFGGKEHIWIRMSKQSHKRAVEAARASMAAGYTFDSIIERLLGQLDVEEFTVENREHLTVIPDTSDDEESIDGLMGTDDVESD